jgi:hypothetical protein
MNTTTEHPSVTPILDLLKPLPKSYSTQVSNRSIVVFLSIISMISFTGNLSFLVVPFSFLPIAFLVCATHELGHLIAGRCVGLRFRGVNIGQATGGKVEN